MFKAISRSWHITKLSFSVINKDKELLLFPVLAGIFSILFMAVTIAPALMTALVKSTGLENVASILYFIIAFIIYFGLAFIATFFNVCVVYTTKIRFEGGNATFMESLKFAVSKIHLIFLWSLVAATVSMILNWLEQASERMGPIAGLILNFIRGLIGVVWSVVTIFVVPAMVYHNCGPFQAIKQSAIAIKKTWGESIIRHFGLGFIRTLFFLAGIVIFIPLVVVCFTVGWIVAAPVIVIAVIYFLAVGLIFALANSIFNTALYVYANTGSVPGGYTEEVLQNAFRMK